MLICDFFLNDRLDCNEPYEIIDNTDNEIHKYEAEMKKIQESASLFEINVPDFKQLKQCRKELRMLKVIYIVVFSQSPIFNYNLNLYIVKLQLLMFMVQHLQIKPSKHFYLTEFFLAY